MVDVLSQLWTSLTLIRDAQVIDVLHPGRPNVPKVITCPPSSHAQDGQVLYDCQTTLLPFPLGVLPAWADSMHVLIQAELKEKLGKMYDVRENSSVFVFGFRTQVLPGLNPDSCMRDGHAAEACCHVLHVSLGEYCFAIAHACRCLLAVWRWQVYRIRPHL